MDLFENTVLCKNCGKKMKPCFVEKEGFKIRALQCPSCSNKILHPSDIEEFNRFNSLRNRQFHVKLRMVGNSYTVSIPREIVNFMKESESEMHEMSRKMHEEMQNMVTLAMDQSNRVSMMFNEESNHENNNIKPENQEKKIKAIKIVRIRKNG